ncbi:hypothetical protein SAMN06264364_11555 [Quadrisphaera granulorum]|uniref:Uncharacterized protein n=1 Tax=Quadrisphaera granulorum TaxID=317664 RepID=A0A316A743_9ACTN|nr:hypothetical protein [Quadrisphaera granulorum]PWJ53038.1 hypothetical protein BXY45_11555 [Quadrisphaera granulorum]SZE97203.1 hypothetical protein SAMN06264364_11555 [Quadrisphaera granulorum]
MRTWVLGLWLCIVGPFIGVVAVGGPGGGVVDHLLQHVVMIALGVVSLWVISRLRRATPSQTVTMTAGVLFVVQVLFLIGNLGESVAVVRQGGFGVGEVAFEDPVHEFFSYITPLSFLVAVLLVVVVSVEAAVVGLRARSKVAVAGDR